MAHTRIISILVLLLNIFVLTQKVQAQSEVTIGTGISTTAFIPVNRYYNYSSCEAIYLSSEVGQSGEITKIRYYKSNNDDASNISATKIYLKTTSSSTLSTGSYSLTGYTKVFDGTVTNSSGAGWKEITLQSTYNYNNQQNLSILILHGYQTYTNNYPLWRYSTTSLARCRYDYSDTQLPTSLGATTGRPNIQLVLNCYRPTANARIDVSICNGSNTTIGGSPSASGGSGSGYSYNWSPSTGLNSTTIANPTTNTTVSTTYTLTVTDGAGCTSLADTVNIEIGSTNQTILANKNMTYYIDNANYYDNGGASGDYNLNMDIEQTFYPCDITKAVKINFTSLDLEYNLTCSWDYIKIYDGPSTASPLLGTYCDTTVIGSKTSSHSSGALTIQFVSDESVTGAGWAAQLSQECRILPIANAGFDKSICNGSNTTIGGSPSASGGSGSGYTYNWSPSTGLNSTTIANPTTSATVSTTYTLTVTDGAGCSSISDAVEVNVSSQGQTYLANNNNTYYIENGNYYDNGGAGGNYTYNQNVTQTFYPCDTSKTVKINFTSLDLEYHSTCYWDYIKIYNGPSTASPSLGTYCGTTTIGSKTSSHSSGALTIQFVSDTSVTGAGWAAQLSQVCKNLPVADAGQDKGTCSNDTITINGSASGGVPPYTYSWTPTTNLSNSTIPNPVASPTTTTTYTLVVTDNIGCSSAGDAVKLTINSPTAQYLATTNGTYKVSGGKFYDSGGPGSGPSHEYNYNEHKVITFIPCGEYKRVRAHFNLLDIESNIGCSWDWMKVYDGTDTLAPLISYVCGYWTNYEVVAENPTGALTFVFHSDNVVSYDGWDADLIVECQPPKADAGANTSVCSTGQTIQLGGNPTASGGSLGGYTYNWTPITGLSSATEPNPTVTINSETHYYLQVTDSSNCVSAHDSIYIYIADTAQEYRATKNGNYYVDKGHFYDSGGSAGDYSYDEDNVSTFYPCHNNTKLKLSFTTFDLEAQASCNYDWMKIYDGPNVNSTLIGTYCGTNSPSNIMSTHSTGAITVVFHSDFSITGAGWEANISHVCNQVIADAGVDKTICSGDSIIIGGLPAVTGGTAYLDINWTPSAGLSSTTIGNPIVSPGSTTTYILLLTDSVCGTDADTVIVNVLPIPEAIAGNDTIIMLGDSVNIGTQNTMVQVNYLWSPITGLDFTTISYPVANPDSTTLYTVVASNTCGTDSDQVLVAVKYLLEVNYTITNQTFDSNGSIELNVIGGEAPYIFVWESTNFNGLTDSIMDTTYVGYFENLIPGYYAVNIYDALQQNIKLNFLIGEESVWEYNNGVQLSNGTIVKTGEDGWNTGVVQSVNRLNENVDGTLEYKVSDSFTKTAIGFRDVTNTDNNGLTGLNLGFVIENGVANIYEEGQLLSNGISIQNDDILKIERINSDVYYKKNDVVIRTQTIENLNTRSLGIQAGLFGMGSIITQPPALISRDDPYFPVYNIIKDYFTCKPGEHAGWEQITVNKKWGYGFTNYTYEWSYFEEGTFTILGETSNVLSQVSPNWYKVKVVASNTLGQQYAREFNIIIGNNIFWEITYGYKLINYPNYSTTTPPMIKKKPQYLSTEDNSGFCTKDVSMMREFKNGWVGNIVKQKGQIIKAFGLSEEYSEGTIDKIDYAFVYNNNVLEIRENGDVKYLGSYFVNDVLIISRSGYKIKYWKNGILLRQVSTNPELRLMVDGSIFSKGGYFKDIVTDFCNDHKCDIDIYEILKPDFKAGINKPCIYYVCSGNHINIDFKNYIEQHYIISEIIPNQNIQILQNSILEIIAETSTTYQVAFQHEKGCISYLQIAINVIDCTPAENNGIVLNNFGARIIITTGYSINVYGSIYNSNGGAAYVPDNKPRWYNEGLIQFTKNWTNNSNSHVFEDLGDYVTKGEVRTIGDYQKIKGTNYTQFYNLTLTNYGKKEQFVDARVINILDLVNSELDVNNYTMYIDNVEATAIHKNAGYVVTHTEPDKHGWLERKFNDNKKRLFPVAGYNSSEQLRYRPVEIEVETGGINSFKVMCVHDNPVNFEQRKAANIDVLNDKFYHAIQQTEPDVIPANITIYYDELVDGHFQSMAHLDDVSTIYPPIGAPVWKTASNFNFANAAGINSSVTISGWNDYVNDKFALTQAGITINTDDYGSDGSNTFGITGPYNNGDPYDPSLNTGQTNNTGDDVNIVPEVIPVAGEDNHYIITVNPGSENTGVSINLEIDNSLTIQNVTIEYDNNGDGTSEPYILSSDLYEIVDGNVFILHANPKDFGPECLNNLKLSLKDGLVLTPLSSDGLFQNLEITGFNNITELSLIIKEKTLGITVYSASGNALLSSPWDGKISGVHTPGLYEFELQITSAPGAVLKGQIVVE